MSALTPLERYRVGVHERLHKLYAGPARGLSRLASDAGHKFWLGIAESCIDEGDL